LVSDIPPPEEMMDLIYVVGILLVSNNEGKIYKKNLTNNDKKYIYEKKNMKNKDRKITEHVYILKITYYSHL
jgi:hypothetical protein